MSTSEQIHELNEIEKQVAELDALQSKMDAFRALVAKLDEALNGEDGILHAVIRDMVGSELDDARKALELK